uniref:Uncharacterized protein n=1 Tax=Caenorhabditis japonica TaxID=281687 RepID=A0A8R1ISE7_CAEJA
MRSNYSQFQGSATPTNNDVLRRPRGPRTPDGEPTERPSSSNSSISNESYVPPPPPPPPPPPRNQENSHPYGSVNTSDVVDFDEHRPRKGPKTPPLPPEELALAQHQHHHQQHHSQHYGYNFPAYQYNTNGYTPYGYHPHPHPVMMQQQVTHPGEFLKMHSAEFEI